jgi:hypothetical protein
MCVHAMPCLDPLQRHQHLDNGLHADILSCLQDHPAIVCSSSLTEEKSGKSLTDEIYKVTHTQLCRLVKCAAGSGWTACCLHDGCCMRCHDRGVHAVI